MPHIFHITYREINLYEQKTIHSRTYTYVCNVACDLCLGSCFWWQYKFEVLRIANYDNKKVCDIFGHRMIPKCLIELKDNVAQVFFISWSNTIRSCCISWFVIVVSVIMACQITLKLSLTISRRSRFKIHFDSYVESQIEWLNLSLILLLSNEMIQLHDEN